MENKKNFALGIESLKPRCLEKWKNCSIALITNQTGLTQDKERTIDVLIKHGLNIMGLYPPEHGLEGTISAGKATGNSIDPRSGIPIISLYEGNSKIKQFTTQELENITAFFIHLQDCGMRHYTYSSTMLDIMHQAAIQNKEVVVFDSPNPLGDVVEGPLVDEKSFSFISKASIPWRHGMSMGELALYFNKHVLSKECRLKVIPMKNYVRSKGFEGSMLAPLSPNIQSLEACYNYSFLGSLSTVEPFEVGLGTPQAFQYIKVNPEKSKLVRWDELQRIIEFYGITTELITSEKAPNSVVIEGIKVQTKDIKTTSAFRILLAILFFFKKSKVEITYLPIFKLMVGTSLVQAVLEGKYSKEEFYKNVDEDNTEFLKKVKPLLLYDPPPQVYFLSKNNL